LYGIHKNLCKKYRLAGEPKTIRENEDDSIVPEEANNATESAGQPPATAASSAPTATPTPPVTTGSTPKGGVLSPTSTPKPPPAQPAQPTNTKTPVIKDRDSQLNLPGDKKEKTTGILGKGKSALMKTIGGALKARQAISDVVNEYSRRRMETFLHYGGGFSPAMRQQVTSQASKAATDVIANAYLSGKGISLGNANKVVGLVHSVYHQRIPQNVKDHIISEITKAHGSGTLDKFGVENIKKIVAHYKKQPGYTDEEVGQDEEHEDSQLPLPDEVRASSNPTTNPTKGRRR
jgi:ABC-type molybdenum transport system ATPase subunit/photorepair protein PhrA